MTLDFYREWDDGPLPGISDEDFLRARDGFDGFFPKHYSEIWSQGVMQLMMDDLAVSLDDVSEALSTYRAINDPFNISNLEGLSQPEIDQALAPVLEQTIPHPSNSRILLANFNGAAVSIRHSNVDAIIVKDSEKPHDMLTEACEGQEIEFLIHDTIRNVLQNKFKDASDDVLNEELQRLSFRTILQGIHVPDRFIIGKDVREEIQHLQNIFKYATGKISDHHEAIIQATGPKTENPMQGAWHFDRYTIESELMLKAILDGRALPEQKYLAIKTARGQDTQYTPEVLDRDMVLRWEREANDHDAIAQEINAEDVIHNGILFTKVSMAGELLAKIQVHNDFVHRSPTVMCGFARMAYALGG